MKTKLLKMALCAFVAALPIGTWADDYGFGDEVSVNSRTLWTFGSDTDFPAATYYNATIKVNDAAGTPSAYIRKSGVISSLESSQEITLADGQIVTVTKTLKFASAISNASNMTADFTAAKDLDSKNPERMFAFNAEVPGTVYVWVKGDGTSGRTDRIYHRDLGVDKNSSLRNSGTAASSTLHEIKYTSSNKGAFFIGSADSNFEIYAVLFVPTPAVTTVWKFEQYVKDDEAIFYESEVGASAGEYVDGLYFHSRDKKTTEHGVRSKKTKVTNGNLETHFGTYLNNTDYMAALLGSGGGTAPGDVEAGTCTTIDGISFKAPAAGKFYATVVRETNTTVYVYKNGEQADYVTFSDETPAKEFEIAVDPNDNIYLFITTEKGKGKQVYLWNAGFIPTTAKGTVRYIPISEAGYATFSATKNFNLDEDLEAYIVTDVTSSAATLKKVTEIPACTGVILKGSAKTYTLTSKESTTVDVSDNKLKANIANYILPNNDGNGNYNYTLAAGPTFKHVASENPGELAAGKAFLRTTVDVSGSRSINLVFDEDETTGISTVKVQNEEVTNGEYYDLMGRRVTNPTKGLYIVNGKKVFIK